MKVFQKVMNRIKRSTGLYKLASYWTAADTVEFNDGQTLEQCKTSFENAINNKGDTLYYDSETHMLYLLSGEDRLSGVEILSSGQGEILGDVSDVSIEVANEEASIKWTDPEDGEDIEWQGTIVMRKANSRPVDCVDGTLVVDSTIKNQYQSEGFLDENLSSNTNYYYRFFPYSTEGQIRTGISVSVKTEVDESYIEEYPSVKGTYTYTGQTQNVQFDNFNADKMSVTSGGSGINADTYTVVITPKNDYKWPDGSTTGINLTWVINKAIISLTPSQSGSVSYTGSSRTPTWLNYDSTKLDISGDTSATNAGEYTVLFTPKSNYQWEDGTIVGKESTWTIQRALISNTPVQSGTLSYNGSTKTPSWSYYNTSQLTIGGQTSGIDVGTYTAVFTPTSNYQWNDYTITGKEIQWTIVETKISIPSQSGTLTYDGTSKTPTWRNYNADRMTKTETAQINAGTYSSVFSLAPGYAWSDGTLTDKTVNWTINKATISTPSATGTLSYNGNSQSPTWNSYYDSNKMTLGGTTSAINAGTYTATFTPKTNYQWSGGSTSAKSVTWKINQIADTLTLSKQSITFTSVNATDTSVASGYHGVLSVSTSNSSIATASISGSTITITCKGTGNATITVKVAASTNYTTVSKTISVASSAPQTISTIPTQKGTITYSGSSKTPSWNNYNTSQLILGGTTSAINAGTYTATFTPKTGYVWSDGTSTAKEVDWTIRKASLSFSISPTSATIEVDEIKDISLTGYTSTYDSSVGYIPNVTVSVTPVGACSTNIYNISSTSGAKCRIIGQSIGTATVTFKTNDPNYNEVTKTLTLTIKSATKSISELSVGDLVKDANGSLFGSPVIFRIIGKNHTYDWNTGMNNTVSLEARDLVACKYYNSSSSDAEYSQSALRTWLNGTFYNSLSSTLRNKIITSTFYTRRQYASSGEDSYSLQDKIFILSATELGARKLAHEGFIPYSDGTYDVFDYYKNASDSVRQKKLTSGAVANADVTYHVSEDFVEGKPFWRWCRGSRTVLMNSGVTNENVATIERTGSVGYSPENIGWNGVAPAMTVSNTLTVSAVQDSDGCYVIY